jgi:hypothetical protein
MKFYGLEFSLPTSGTEEGGGPLFENNIIRNDKRVFDLNQKKLKFSSLPFFFKEL